jgi:phosphoribosylformylglycinamidine cyclo-ligase
VARGVSYRDAGVDIDAGDEAVERIKSVVRRTFGPRVFGDLGGFAGCFRLDYNEKLFARNYREPLLVACTDGVGSKLLVGIESARTRGAAALRSLGIDLVAMNVNDLLCTGAEPLFFLDYVAVHKLEPAMVAEIVSGIADGCVEAGCALIGGETAELPELYAPGHFDLAGFAVGVVDRRRLPDPKRVEPGDVVLGLASSGVHSNGYALARHVLLRQKRLKLTDTPDGLDAPLGEVLLRPTRIYVEPVLSVLRRYRRKRVVRSMAHITGGGLPGNLPRAIPCDCDIVIRKESWPVPPIFELIRSCGVAEEEMYRVFNMGIGFALIVAAPFARSIAARLRTTGEKVYNIGVVRKGTGQFAWK